MFVITFIYTTNKRYLRTLKQTIFKQSIVKKCMVMILVSLKYETNLKNTLQVYVTNIKNQN